MGGAITAKNRVKPGNRTVGQWIIVQQPSYRVDYRSGDSQKVDSRSTRSKHQYKEKNCRSPHQYMFNKGFGMVS